MKPENETLINQMPRTKLTESHPGLTTSEARTRLQQFGPNALPEKPPKTLGQRLLLQFKSPLIYILLAALVIDLAIWVIEGAEGYWSLHIVTARQRAADAEQLAASGSVAWGRTASPDDHFAEPATSCLGWNRSGFVFCSG